MKNKIVIILNIHERNETIDIEIPSDITVRELIIGLNEAFKLGIDITDTKQCYLKSEDPIAFLYGDKNISSFGLRDGSIVHFTR